MEPVSRHGRLLYPMLLIAAISVIVLSATGIATMMGWMPSALSTANPGAGVEAPDPRATRAPGPDSRAFNAPEPAPRAAQAPVAPPPPAARTAGAASRPVPPLPACRECGVVESIRAIEVQGPDSWLGAAGGAVVGGLLGNQVGQGRGRTAATVVGAGAGAYAGNEIEKRVTRSVRYQVRVRMSDGTLRTFQEAAQPPYAVGQKVRITPQGAIAAG